MLQGRVKRELSIVVLVGTLSIFLFSVPVGPYSAVHGPATAFRAFHASLILFWSIAVASLNLVLMPSLFTRSILLSRWPWSLHLESSTLTRPQLHLLLRC